MPSEIPGNLTEEEAALVHDLERIAASWPKHLVLIVNPESVRSVYVARADSDGGYVERSWGSNEADPESIIGRIPIRFTTARVSS